MIIKKGFLFDLDGVIIDSEKEYSRIWHRINELWPTGVPELERVIKGCTLTSILDTYFTDTDRKAVTDKLYELEAKMSYYFAPGAERFLNECKRLGIPMALVTSSDNYKMGHLTEQMPGLLDYFDTVITANDISHSKPDPEGYLKAAGRLGLAPADCVVFEDSLQGIAAGRAAGAKVVGIAATLGRDRVQPVADICVEDLSEISSPESI